MDLCITAEEPFAYEPPKCKPFAPVSRPSTATASPPRHRKPGPFASSSPLIPLPAAFPASELEFDLIIHDPSNDSSLTHPWDLPQTPLRVPLNTTKVQLLDILRAHLPKRGEKDASEVTPRRSRALRRQKLVAVTLYWTFRGMILPLGPKDEDWHYRNPITKTDLLDRTELEWFLLKEMMAASGGALKCYFAIRGEATPVKKSTGWWFGSSA
ncbi:hypothetical protein FZEAL_5648 [Fusarium zealandicum]|uniref:Uncharacterized protein n=1 Tax=Fusarium zealandicum TaxID=1053134 RepID=A0A8H4UJG3_9HYPO|nr:hypothetical protein FZEAL_5648 [Fusarium zealandicum]